MRPHDFDLGVDGIRQGADHGAGLVLVGGQCTRLGAMRPDVMASLVTIDGDKEVEAVLGIIGGADVDIVEVPNRKGASILLGGTGLAYGDGPGRFVVFGHP